MAHLGEVFLLARLDNSLIRAEAAEAGTKAGEKFAETFKESVKSLAVGLIGVEGIREFYKEVIEGGRKAEESTKRVEVAARNSGVAWNLASQGMEKATKAGVSLGFNAEQLKDTYAILLTRTHSVNLATKELSEAENLSRLRKIDLANAGDIITRVHQGNSRVLKSLGVDLKANATESEKNAAITKALANIQGQAAGYAETLGGRMEALKAKFQENAATLGEDLNPKLAAGIGFFTEHGRVIAEILGPIAGLTLAWKAGGAALFAYRGGLALLASAKNFVTGATFKEQVAAKELAVANAQLAASNARVAQTTAQKAVATAEADVAAGGGIAADEALIAANAELVIANEAVAASAAEAAVAEDIATGGLALIPQILAAVGIGAVGAAGGFALFGGAAKEAEPEVTDFTEAIKRDTEALGQNTAAIGQNVQAQLIKQLHDDKTQESLQNLGFSETEYVKGILGNKEAYDAEHERLERRKTDIDNSIKQDRERVLYLQKRDVVQGSLTQAEHDEEEAANSRIESNQKVSDSLGTVIEAYERHTREIGDQVLQEQINIDINNELADSYGHITDELLKALQAREQHVIAVTDANKAILEERQHQQELAQAVTQASSAVSDANQSLADAQQRAREDAVSSSQAIVDANDTLVKSHKAVAEAEIGVGKARQEAAKNIRDLKQAIKDLRDEEEGHRISLAEANLQAFLTSGLARDSIERRQALLRQSQAQHAVEADVTKRDDLTGQLSEAQRKGIEGSDVVTQAKLKLQDAKAQEVKDIKAVEKAKSDAAKKEIDDNRAVGKAHDSLAKAKDNLTKSQDAANTSLQIGTIQGDNNRESLDQLWQKAVQANPDLANNATAFEAIGQHAGFSAPQVQAMANQLGLIPQPLATTLNLLASAGIVNPDTGKPYTAVNIGSVQTGAGVQRSTTAHPLTGAGTAHPYGNYAGTVVRAEGGPIWGGIPGKDSVPVWAMPGEFMQQKDAVDHYGMDFMHALNNKQIPKLAGGGSIAEIIAAMKSSGISGYTINATNPSGFMGPPHANDGGFHSSSHAVDFGGGGSASIRDKVAEWWYTHYGTKLLEEIHTKADGATGWFIKNGKVVSPSYYRSVLAEHMNHVHIAANEGFTQGLVSGFAAGSVGTEGVTTPTVTGAQIGKAVNEILGKVGQNLTGNIQYSLGGQSKPKVLGSLASLLPQISADVLTSGKSSGAIGSPEVARIAEATARSMGATDQQLLALMETGIVESGMRNLPYGDRDSLGFLQQRASWGSAASRQNVAESTARFIRKAQAKGVYPTAGRLAQAVQVSAFPDRYDQERSGAIAWLNKEPPLIASTVADNGAVLPPRSTTLVTNNTDQPEGVGFGMSRRDKIELAQLIAQAIHTRPANLTVDGEVIARKSVDAVSDIFGGAF